MKVNQKPPMIMHDRRSLNMRICDDSKKVVDELLDSDILNNASHQSGDD